MTFSLIVATLKRSDEFRHFLDSVLVQRKLIFELIVVDQNDDDRIEKICAAYAADLPLRHVRSSVRESSHARNIGISLSTGDIIAFPDDDCLYPADLLEQVDARFRDGPDLAVLSGPAVAPSGQLGSGRWNTRSGPLTLDNVWTSVIEFNLFIRRTALAAVGPFDEELGVGARFGSGEAADLAIRIMNAGFETRYDRDIRVVHPDKRLSEQAVSRAFVYGLGLGRILRRHHPLSRRTASFFTRPVGGMLLGALSGRSLKRRYYWQTFRGRLQGYLAPPTRWQPLRTGLDRRDSCSSQSALHHERQ